MKIKESVTKKYTVLGNKKKKALPEKKSSLLIASSMPLQKRQVNTKRALVESSLKIS